MKLAHLAICLPAFLLLKGSFLHAQAVTFSINAIAAQRLPVTYNKMTNLVFAAPIRTGVKVSRDIMAQKVKGVDNVLEVKATQRNFQETNLSVYGIDGRLYSFDLYYADSPAVTNYQIGPSKAVDTLLRAPMLLLTGLPTNMVKLKTDAETIAISGFMDHSSRNERVTLRLKGIYLKDSLLWFSFRMYNRSKVPYIPEYYRLYIGDRSKVKRSAIQTSDQTPIYVGDMGMVNGNSLGYLALAYPLFTIPKDKKIVFQIAEHNGGRLEQLKIDYKTLLKAKQL